MALLLSFFVIAVPTFSATHPVDFQISNRSPPGVSRLATLDPAVDIGIPVITKPQFSTARGFGHHVPLSFAVRQIVPPAVHVSYGPGVEHDTPIDWQGGAPWNRVLKAALAPAGLHTHTGSMSVRISKQ